jgi:UPF0271 protein
MMYIDLNCDMGEGYGMYTLGYDEEALPYITSVNAACGFHASDPMGIQQIVRLAKKHNVAVGAHPSHPDLVGFGRRNMDIPLKEIKANVIYQIGALWAFCKSEGVKMQHVKAHGALYNQAAKDVGIAEAIAEAIKEVDPDLYMLCLANSMMTVGAKNIGVKYVEEAFADRAYNKDGTLVARSIAGSVIHNIDEVAERVVSMVKNKNVKTLAGEEIGINAQTICVHGDTPGAVDMIKKIHASLKAEGVTLRPFGA